MSSDTSGSRLYVILVLLVVPLLVTIAGGLAVEYLKPGENKHSSPVGTTPISAVSPAPKPNPTPPDSPSPTEPGKPNTRGWLSVKWWRPGGADGSLDDVLLATNTGKMINKVGTATFIYTINETGELLLPDAKDLGDRIEKVRFVSATNDELTLVWHYKEQKGWLIDTKASEQVVLYKPISSVIAKHSRTAWITLGIGVVLALAAIVVLGVSGNQVQTDDEKKGLGCIVALLGIPSVILVCVAINSFQQMYRYQGF